MVTKGPFPYFLRSFYSYCNQDYSNKELVVVPDYDGDYCQRVRNYILSTGRHDVTCVVVKKKLSLGALRNISLQHASGPLVCQWDDDDLFHSRRLSIQINAMESAEARASFLSDIFHLFCDTRKLYWCDWMRSRNCLGFPASLVAHKDVVPCYPATFTYHEDSVVQRDILSAGTRTAILSGSGYLYVYTFNGSNTFDRKHHAGLARAYGFETATIQERRETIEARLSEHNIEPPISVSDYLGREVFTWTERRKPTDYNGTSDFCKVFVL